MGAMIRIDYWPKTAAIRPGTRVLEACPACGEDHAWGIQDAFLDGMPDARTVGTAVVTRAPLSATPPVRQHPGPRGTGPGFSLPEAALALQMRSRRHAEERRTPLAREGAGALSLVTSRRYPTHRSSLLAGRP